MELHSVNDYSQQIDTVIASISSMNTLDYCAIILIVVSLLFSVWRGLIGEAFSIGGWVLAFYLAHYFGSSVGYSLYGKFINNGLLVQIAGWITIILPVLLIMSYLCTKIRRLTRMIGFTVTDRFLGLFVGFFRALVFLVIITFGVGLTPLTSEPLWQQSVLAKPLQSIVIDLLPYLPPEVSKLVSYH